MQCTGGECSSMSKYVRRFLRGPKLLKGKPSHRRRGASLGGSGCDQAGVPVELSTSSSLVLERQKDSVVRIVLWSGMVELYTGVVMAGTVMEKHPGLCVAHPEVFKNPHDSIVEPREPLFPGQKFYLLPKSTLDKLRQKIPGTSSDATGVAEEAPPERGLDEATSEEEGSDMEEPVPKDPICFAREFYVANDQWSECFFRRMVALGLEAEQKQEEEEKAPEPEPEPKAERIEQKQKHKQKEREAATSDIGKTRTPKKFLWEPSLPSVEEEISPSHTGALSGPGANSVSSVILPHF